MGGMLKLAKAFRPNHIPVTTYIATSEAIEFFRVKVFSLPASHLS
jgi:hypothetical protein